MNQVDFEYENGDVLKDKVSGFEGVVMVKAQYSTGCVHYGLESQNLKDGLPQAWQWLDQSRLVLVKKSVVSFKVDEDQPSGPFPSGPQS